MVVSLATVAVAALIAVSFQPSAPTTLFLQLIQRCPPAAACVAPRIVWRMRNETEQIWSSLDVRIAWVDSRPDADLSRGRLTVFLEGEGAPAPRPDAPVLASLSLPAEPCDDGLARIWLRNVQRQVASVRVSGVPFENLPNALTDLILARALGRALAHEIGHYLLRTSVHADRGLMRARFAPLEFVESLNPRYGLEARERQSLASCSPEPTQSIGSIH